MPENRNVRHGSNERTFPSFNSRAKQITPPLDVASCVMPEVDVPSYWAGEKVWQMKFRSEEQRRNALSK